MSVKFTTSVDKGAAKLCIQGLFFKVRHYKFLKALKVYVSVFITSSFLSRKVKHFENGSKFDFVCLNTNFIHSHIPSDCARRHNNF